MKRQEKLEGRVFGRLTVARYLGVKHTSHHNYECLCDCGRSTSALANNLKRGRTASCGCLELELKTRHGHSPKDHANRSSEHVAWAAMRARCHNPRAINYADYGGRGITVDSCWDDFTAFLSFMGPRPSPGHSVDRIDNNGNYAPGNCRWATRLEQNLNKRTRRNSATGISGVGRTKEGKFYARAWVGGCTRYLGTFDNSEDAAECVRRAKELRSTNEQGTLTQY